MPIFASIKDMNDILGRLLAPISNRLLRIDSRSERTQEGLLQMSEALKRLTQDVADLKTAASSARAMIEGLSAQIRANAGDEAAMTALADDLDTVKADLAGAVAANTAAAVEPDATNGGLAPVDDTTQPQA